MTTGKKMRLSCLTIAPAFFFAGLCSPAYAHHVAGRPAYTMTHPGLPLAWVLVVLAFMGVCGLWALLPSSPGRVRARYLSLGMIPVLGRWIRVLTTSPWPQLIIKLTFVALFVLIIVAGLIGSPVSERNIATALTWNVWWTGVVISVFFLGSAWCGACPWDALATWLVRRRLWRPGEPGSSLNRHVPRWMQNVLPAMLLFVGLTWLELGVGVTTSPFGTALIGLLMLMLATLSLALFERKAFCRYFCPVGRTLGFYAQLAPIELRPIDTETCAKCTTLDCYHGNKDIEPCPTRLVMGRLTQNTYCTSCGACTRSCPYRNVSWRLRPMSSEAIQYARPHWDEAWFMLGLLALTSLHGLTMLLFWEDWMSNMASAIGDSERHLWSFSIALGASLLVVALLYTIVIALTSRLMGEMVPFKRAFAGLAFAALPLAFAYHLAHNLNHLVRESTGLGEVLANPLGIGAQPLSMMERHARHMALLMPENVLFAFQAGLMLFGFWIAVQVLRHRGRSLLPAGQSLRGWQLLPMLVFIASFTAFNTWLLMEPMAVRMW